MFRIRRFGVVRTANLAGVLYLVLSLIFILPFVIILAAAGPMSFTDQSGRTTNIGFAPLFLLLLPILYAIGGWIFTALMCLVYNLAARVTGGVEVQLVGDVQPTVRSDVPASS